MNTKLILWILVVAIVSSGVTIVSIHIYQQKKAAQTQQQMQTATTNVMMKLKPDTSPAIFPNK